MPDQLAGVGFQGENAREEEIVSSAGAANFPIPGRAVARADVQEIKLRIIRQGVPHVAAPRFTTSHQAFWLKVRGTAGSHFQSSFPVRASMAKTMLQLPVV